MASMPLEASKWKTFFLSFFLFFFLAGLVPTYQVFPNYEGCPEQDHGEGRKEGVGQQGRVKGMDGNGCALGEGTQTR